MNKIAIVFGLMFAALAASAAPASGAYKSAASADALTRTVTSLDTALFDAFNHCDAPGELQKERGKGVRFICPRNGS